MSDLDIEKIRLCDIEPASYNPRIINTEQYNKLSRSIQEYGLVDPIIINLRNKKIIGGHQRYKVLLDEYTSTNQELYLIRLGDIGWAFPDTDLKISSEEHEKALNVALNQQNLMGEWDTLKLENLLKDLDELDFDLTLTGFDETEIDLLFDGDYETFNFNPLNTDEEEEADELPSDYADVTGDTANKSYVISIGFNDHETANKYLDFLGYERHMNGDTLQFMFTDVDWDLDQALLEKYGEDYFQEQKIK